MLRLLLVAPFLLVLIAFALSNEQTVQLGLWPTDFMLEAPLSIAILAAGAVFFLMGALIVWISLLGARARARRAERRIATLEAELREVRAATVSAATSSPPRKLLTLDH